MPVPARRPPPTSPPPSPRTPVRVLRLPLFGARLRQLRGAQSRRAICTAIEIKTGAVVDATTLLQYERGTVHSPDPLILWGLARVFHVELDDLVTLIVAERTGRHMDAGIVLGSGLTSAQVHIAEIYAGLQPALQDAFKKIAAGLDAAAHPRSGRDRYKE